MIIADEKMPIVSSRFPSPSDFPHIICVPVAIMLAMAPITDTNGDANPIDARLTVPK